MSGPMRRHNFDLRRFSFLHLLLRSPAPFAVGESGRQDSNLRPLDPQSSALTRLRYAPSISSHRRRALTYAEAIDQALYRAEPHSKVRKYLPSTPGMGPRRVVI